MKKRLKSLLSGLRSFRGNSLLVRGILITFLAVILLLSGVLTVAYNIAKSLVQDSVLEMNREITSHSIDSMNTVLDQAARVGASLSLDEDVLHFMLGEESSAGLVKRVSEACSSYSMIFGYIHSIYIYAEESGSMCSNVYNGPVSGWSDQSWQAGYSLAAEDRVYAVSRVRDNGYPYFITVIVPYFFYQGEKTGAVMVNLDMDKLDKLLLGLGSYAEQTVSIIGGDGQVMYCNDRSLYQADAESHALLGPALAALGESFIHTDSEGERTVVSSARLVNRGWRLVSALPLTYYDAAFDKLGASMRQLVIWVAAAGALLALLLAVRSYLPVRGILASLEESGHEPLTAPERPMDETDYIRQAIAASAKSNITMKLELAGRIRLLHEAQASALQAQITPHFISNTLDAIRWGAVELGKGENEVSQMLTTLSALLRISLDMESALVPISTEIEHCQLYLEIMKYRYNAPLDVTWEIPEDILRLSIVKLSFQPILENAIYHGLRPKKMLGRILVQALRDEGRVYIRFADSGVGMNGDTLERLNLEMDSETALTGSHIGMHNVNQRIKLLFGLDYGVRVSSVEGNGTIIEVVIPGE